MSTSAILAVVFAALWGIDNALAAVPSIKANNLFQVFSNIIAVLAGKADK